MILRWCAGLDLAQRCHEGAGVFADEGVDAEVLRRFSPESIWLSSPSLNDGDEGAEGAYSAAARARAVLFLTALAFGLVDGLLFFFRPYLASASRPARSSARSIASSHFRCVRRFTARPPRVSAKAADCE